MLMFGSIASLRHKNDLQQVITSILTFSSAEGELLLSWRSQESSKLKKGEEEDYPFEKFQSHSPILSSCFSASITMQMFSMCQMCQCCECAPDAPQSAGALLKWVLLRECRQPFIKGVTIVSVHQQPRWSQICSVGVQRGFLVKFL